jgi:hypothetical protein
MKMRHQTISFIKSGIRILGYLILFMTPDLAITAAAPFNPGLAVALRVSGIVLVVSEVIGIVEEIGAD